MHQRRRVLLQLAATPFFASLPMTSVAQSLTRKIPKSNEPLPAIGLGTWQSFDIANRSNERASAKEALEALVAGGSTLVDSSPMYGSSETVVGELARDAGIADRLFVATKVWTRGRAEGIRQMESSIAKMMPSSKRALDLMQVHNLLDVETHLATLRDWKTAGRVRYIGVTHYNRGAHAELEQFVKRVPLDFLQINYSIAEPEAANRLLPAAREAGVAVIVNRPFAEGAMFERVKGKPVPEALAKSLGVTSWAQLFLKWILANEAVTCIIPGTRNARHVRDNLAAGAGPLPTAAELQSIKHVFAGG
jgi:diketogulonate reductase-like aldo/keto reductase